jgi:hypothetical protein
MKMLEVFQSLTCEQLYKTFHILMGERSNTDCSDRHAKTLLVEFDFGLTEGGVLLISLDELYHPDLQHLFGDCVWAALGFSKPNVAQLGHLGIQFFYSYWDVRFAFLMLRSISVDYVVALAIDRESRPKFRRMLLCLS